MSSPQPVDHDGNNDPTLRQIVQCGKLSSRRTALMNHVGSIRPLTAEEQAARTAEVRE